MHREADPTIQAAALIAASGFVNASMADTSAEERKAATEKWPALVAFHASRLLDEFAKRMSDPSSGLPK